MEQVLRARSILDQLVNLAGQNVALYKNRIYASEIERLQKTESEIFSRENDPAVIYIVIYGSMAYAGGAAGDEPVDDVFYVAFDAGVYRITQIGGSAAINTLEYMQARMPLDGVFSLTVREALEKLKSK